MTKAVHGMIGAMLVLVMAQAAVYAQRDGRGPGRGDCPRDGKMRGAMKGDMPCGPLFGNPARFQKELGLSDDQIKKIAEINKQHRQKMLDYREKMAPKNIQMKKLLLEDQVDLAKVRALLKEVSDYRVELHMLRIQHRLDIEKVLTTEQRAKMKSHMMNKMKGKGGGGRGHGPGPGPEPDRD